GKNKKFQNLASNIPPPTGVAFFFNPRLRILAQHRGRGRKTANRSFELVLSDTSTHSASTADTASQHHQHIVNVVGTTPLLMRHNLDAVLHLWFLNEFTIGSHADLGIGLG